MKHQQEQLSKELRAAGASEAELKQLLPLATHLRLLKEQQPAYNGSTWTKLLRPTTYALAGLVVGVSLITVSQAVLPTSRLYPLQEFSDTIAVSFHPDYRATIMMKRAQQVNQLVAAHAGSPVILATLNSYTSIANTYKSTSHANYSAFEFCESNLEQASMRASPTIRKAIANSLQSLENA